MAFSNEGFYEMVNEALSCIVKHSYPEGFQGPLKVRFNMKDGVVHEVNNLNGIFDAKVFIGGDVFPVLMDDACESNAGTKDEVLKASKWKSIEVLPQ